MIEYPASGVNGQGGLLTPFHRGYYNHSGDARHQCSAAVLMGVQTAGTKRILMRRRAGIAALTAMVILSVVGPGSSALAAAGPYEPEAGCYVGAYIDLDKNVEGDVQAFDALVGKRHATFFRYVGYGQPFPFRWVQESRAAGIMPHIAWEPNHGLSAVRDDEYLRGWAEAARRAGGPIFLRYASEMNGTWQEYSGNPAEYIEKWRLVHGVMKSVAPDVIMVWCPFATPQSNIASYYPGDEYVDWVGVNIYSVLHQDGDISKPPSQDPVELLGYVYDLYAERKPIAICEYGATHYCKAERREVTDFAIEQMSRLYAALIGQFPRVRMINWFSVDAVGDKLADNNYSVTSNPEVLATYRSLVSSPHFLSHVVDGTALALKPAEMSGMIISPVPVRPAPVPTPPPTTSCPLAAADIGPLDLEDIWVAVIGAAPEAVSGIVEISVEAPAEMEVTTVTIKIDGRFRCITNVTPYRYRWDTADLKPGEHIIEVEVIDERGRVAGRKRVSAIVAQESNR